MPGLEDFKRIAFMPLHYKGDEDALKKSLVDEIMVDPETGLIYFRKDTNTIVSSKQSIIDLITLILNSGTTGLSYIVNNNRFVYRFYYADGIVRLDRHLSIPKDAAFYRIRDVGDANKYYVHKLTHINQEALSIAPFENNSSYFVEFYNVDAEMISQVLFTAKFAPGLILNEEGPDKIFSHLQIVTNKDKILIGDNLDSLIIRLYCFYEDGTYKDVTDTSASFIDISEINVNRLGTYNIKASYIYDTTLGTRAEVTYPITVIENVYTNLVNIIVVPRKIIKLNDGTKEIRLTIIGYFDDGTVKDISDECVISNSFNDELFNVEQTVTLRFNAGLNNVIDKNVSFTVYDDGSISKDKVFFGNDLISLDDNITYPGEYVKYRIRHPQDLNFFYTINYTEMGYSSMFVDKNREEERLHDNMNVIVEFYGAENNLLASKVFVAKHKGE